MSPLLALLAVAAFAEQACPVKPIVGRPLLEVERLCPTEECSSAFQGYASAHVAFEPELRGKQGSRALVLERARKVYALDLIHWRYMVQAYQALEKDCADQAAHERAGEAFLTLRRGGASAVIDPDVRPRLRALGGALPGDLAIIDEELHRLQKVHLEARTQGVRDRARNAAVLREPGIDRDTVARGVVATPGAPPPSKGERGVTRPNESLPAVAVPAAAPEVVVVAAPAQEAGLLAVLREKLAGKLAEAWRKARTPPPANED